MMYEKLHTVKHDGVTNNMYIILKTKNIIFKHYIQNKKLVKNIYLYIFVYNSISIQKDIKKILEQIAPLIQNKSIVTKIIFSEKKKLLFKKG